MMNFLDSRNFDFDDSEEEPDVFLNIYPNLERKEAVLVLEIDEEEVADCLYIRNEERRYVPADRDDLDNILNLISQHLELDGPMLKRIVTEINRSIGGCVKRNKGISYEIHFDGEIEPLEV